MAKPGKGKTLIGVTMPEEHVLIIDERRKNLRWSRPEYIATIVENWVMQGCPPIARIDETNLIAEGKAPYGKKSR
jgi:hypothetical protein